DNSGPSVMIGAPSASITKGGPVTYTVSYTDPRFASSSLGASNVHLNATGSAAGTLSFDQTPGSTWTVTVSNITGDGTLGVSIDAGSGLDTLGNASPAAGPSATFTVDNSKPDVTISAPSLPLTAGGPVTYTITYSDANFNSSALTAANITLNRTGTA